MKQRRYGEGYVSKDRGKFRARIPDGKGDHISIGTYHTAEEAEQMRAAAIIARGTPTVGTTLRQWGETYLHLIRDHKSIVSTRRTWYSVICDAPFIDAPMAEVHPPEVCEWFEEKLPEKKKKRSVLRNGKRTLVELDEPISRKYAANAMGIAKRCYQRAVKKGLIESNPLAEAEIGPDRSAIEEPMTYLPADEVEFALSCEACARELGRHASDLDMLAQCEHMPFEQRVVFTIAIHQAPREGEIAGLNWERCDWEGRGWYLAQSWDTSPKSGKTRWQAWLPRSERAIRKWWEINGRPASGIVFPSPRLGDNNKPKRYARGHDWGWQDHPEEHVTRLGWWRRVGIRTRVRFHDLRDTAATHLLSGTWGHKWDLKDVSKHLGHSSVLVTEQRYAHLTRDAKRRAAQSTESDPRHAANTPRYSLHRSPKYAESLAPEAGLEPATNRLTAHLQSNDFNDLQVVRRVCGVRGNRGLEAAESLLEAVAQGGGVNRHAATALAKIVMADRAVTLAAEVLADGPHALDRAIELARLVVDEQQNGAATEALSARPKRA